MCWSCRCTWHIGLISNHNVATRWIRHNFDASVCFDGCDNISEVLERLRHIRTNATSFHQDRGWRWVFLSGSTVSFVHFTRRTVVCVFCSQPFPSVFLLPVEVVCPIILVELILTGVWWIVGEFSLRYGILENSLTLWNFKAGKSTSELGFVYDQPILGSLCSGSKKLRLPNQLTNLWHRDRSQGSLIFLISISFMRWLRQPWRSISARSQTSE